MRSTHANQISLPRLTIRSSNMEHPPSEKVRREVEVEQRAKEICIVSGQGGGFLWSSWTDDAKAPYLRLARREIEREAKLTSALSDIMAFGNHSGNCTTTECWPSCARRISREALKTLSSPSGKSKEGR